MKPLTKANFFLCLAALVVLFSCVYAKASDVVEVRPLTNQIIMVHFDDGYATYHKMGQKRSNETVTVIPLDQSKASLAASYSITSPDDPAFSSAANPTQVARKTKGTEFTWICEWDASVNGCVNKVHDHVKEHWVYITLPNPMKSGKTYLIQTGSLAGNGNSWTIDYNDHSTRSDAVHVNILGYNPSAPAKFGYVYQWMGDGGGLDLSSFANNDFYLVNQATGSVDFSGKIAFRKSASNDETSQTGDTPDNNFLGAEVYECDFSTFNTEGEYVLSVQDIGCSLPFKIKNDVLRDAHYNAARALFHNRSGIALAQPYTDFTRPAPHNPNSTPGFAGKLKYTSSRFVDWKSEDHSAEDKPAIEAGIKGELPTWGWYQDAGDWDGYFSHLRVPVLLMLSYELTPEHYADGDLNIPESNNGLSDMLDEARWLIHYFQRTRKLIKDQGYGTGGIGARVAGDWFGSDTGPQDVGTPSYKDTDRTWIVSGEDPFTTYFYAGLSAHFATMLKKAGASDPDGINWETEAREAFIWAENNLKPDDTNPDKVHGLRISNYRLYAAAALFRLTGEQAFHDQFALDASGISNASVFAEDQRWGAYVYALLPDSLRTNTSLHSKIVNAALSSADQKTVKSIEARACRFAGDFSFPMLIGQATTPWVFEAMVGYKLALDNDPAKAEEYLKNIHTTADYFLGCNPLNMVWMTGVGVKNPGRIFHMDSWYNGRKNEMVPGITPYGPWRDQPTSALGPWDVQWPYKTISPTQINKWPGHERWFGNYTCPLNAEFTIHQNTVYSAITYGFLSAVSDGSFQANRRPTVTIKTPTQGGTTADTVDITVQAQDPNGVADIAWVEYYDGWHKIGESTSAPFSFQWTQAPNGNIKLNARIMDKRGMVNYSDTVTFSNTSVITGFHVVPVDEFDLKVYPNPADQKLVFDYQLQSESEVKIILYDMSGSVVSAHDIINMPGKNQYHYHLPTPLRQGMYIYKFSAKSEGESTDKTGKVVFLR